MTRAKALLGAVGLALLVGCGGGTTSFVRSNTTLGRVVVYRNGIAYFERFARVEGDTLKISVPADKLDDFLKSLTVTDAKTGEPAPISYPTGLPGSATGLVELQIKLGGPSPHELKLTYVTEAPSWKPSYRVVLGNDGKVSMEGWAVVDNTSGEDWENVKLGVGSSSALSFKFDLKSVKIVSRDTLQAEDLFATAPPTGGAIYGGEKEGHVAVLDEEATNKIALAEAPKPADVAKKSAGPKYDKNAGYDGDGVSAGYGGAPGLTGGLAGGGGKGKSKAPSAYPMAAPKPTATAVAQPTTPPPPKTGADYAFESTVSRLLANKNHVVIEGYALDSDGDKAAASLERANKVRAQLVQRGVSPDKVVAIGKGLVGGKKGGVRIIEVTPKIVGKPDTPVEGDPIGTSHFETSARMSVKKASSAMISILKGSTEGEATYYYDAESPRGNATFPFRAIRLKNPTDSTLESGPVTVFGDGKFIGEGISEPIPPHASAFVPFALDRQIVVENVDGEKDEILRVLAVQRGVFSTEVKHTKTMKLVFHNRLPTKAKIAIRHTTPKGFTLDQSGFTVEKVGSSSVLGIEVEPGAKKEVSIEESTPVFKTIDLRSPGGMEQVRVFVSSAAVAGPLKEQVNKLVKMQQEIGNLEQRVETTREQTAEYRARIDELHTQIFTLKAVKTGGALMKDLEKKMMEMSDKLTKATLDLVNQQEQLMMARIRFQDAVSELTVKKDDDDAPPKKT